MEILIEETLRSSASTMATLKSSSGMPPCDDDDDEEEEDVIVVEIKIRLFMVRVSFKLSISSESSV